MASEFTVGIEEEFQLVDPHSRDLQSSVSEIIAAGRDIMQDRLKEEIFQHMVEVGTPICGDVEEARSEVLRLRGMVGALAEKVGCKLVAAGTHPFASWQDHEVTPDDRYLSLQESLQDIARSIAVYGLHVHVGVEDRDSAIELMNEMRYFMPHLLALSVNSPFWLGRDTGLKSYRSIIWGRMPRSGTPDEFESWDAYRRFVDILLRTNSIDEPKKIWWDIRPHPHFHTLEFRACDMPTRAEVTVGLAALFQALVAKLARLRSQNLGFRKYPRALIAENRWRAIRYGTEGKLIDLGKSAEVSMKQLGYELLEFIDDVVDDLGSRQALTAIVDVLEHGTGADRQVEIFKETGKLSEVLDFLARETMRGVPVAEMSGA